MMSYTVIMPTINGAPPKLAAACFRSIEENVSDDAELIVCAPERPTCGKRWAWIKQAQDGIGLVDHHRRCRALLGAASHPEVFIVEHDVLYAPGYFDIEAASFGYFSYNLNLKTLTPDGYILHLDPHRKVTSQILGGRSLLEEHFKRALAWMDSAKPLVRSEPGMKWKVGREVFPTVAGNAKRQAPLPSIDVRWGHNLTGNRVADTYEDTCNTWGNAQELRKELGIWVTP